VRLYPFGGVSIDLRVVLRVLESLAKCGVDVLKAPVRESLVAFLSVEAAYVGRGQVLEFAASEYRDDMVMHVALVGVVGGAADGCLDAIS
jgi:hypothetical protein